MTHSAPVKRTDEGGEVGISFYLYASLLHHVLCLVGQSSVAKEVSLLRRYAEESHKDWCHGYVRATQVERPCYLHKVGNDECLGTVYVHYLAYALQFRTGALAYIFLVDAVYLA